MPMWDWFARFCVCMLSMGLLFCVIAAIVIDPSVPVQYEPYMPKESFVTDEVISEGYEFSEEYIADSNYKYSLSFKDEACEKQYLYFTPSEVLSSTVCGYDNGKYYSTFDMLDMSIKIQDGTCWILSRDTTVVTTEFTLSTLSN